MSAQNQQPWLRALIDLLAFISGLAIAYAVFDDIAIALLIALIFGASSDFAQHKKK